MMYGSSPRSSPTGSGRLRSSGSPSQPLLSSSNCSSPAVLSQNAGHGRTLRSVHRRRRPAHTRRTPATAPLMIAEQNVRTERGGGSEAARLDGHRMAVPGSVERYAADGRTVDVPRLVSSPDKDGTGRVLLDGPVGASTRALPSLPSGTREGSYASSHLTRPHPSARPPPSAASPDTSEPNPDSLSQRGAQHWRATDDGSVDTTWLVDEIRLEQLWRDHAEPLRRYAARR